jgi:hypothetical protein
MFLKFCYVGEWDFTHFPQMYHLAVFFGCKALQDKLDEYMVHTVLLEAPTEQFVKDMFVHMLPLIRELRWNSVLGCSMTLHFYLWFHTHFDTLLSMPVEVLSVIPLAWWDFVFGKSKLCMFGDEVRKLEKALHVFDKLGRVAGDEALYVTLFQNIRFRNIPLQVIWNPKYLLLFRRENTLIVQRLFERKLGNVSYERWKLTSRKAYCEMASLSLHVTDFDAAKEGFQWVSDRLPFLKETEGMCLKLTKLDKNTASLYLYIDAPFCPLCSTKECQPKRSCSFALIAIQNSNRVLIPPSGFSQNDVAPGKGFGWKSLELIPEARQLDVYCTLSDFAFGECWQKAR